MGKFLKKILGMVQPEAKPSGPKTSADLLRYGVRWDYDGVVTYENKKCHKFQLQPNAGKIPSTIKQWRDGNGGTHAVIGVLHIPVDTDPDRKVFEDAAKEALKKI